MKGKIFCGLASLILDFKDRVQALCCICRHVASLHYVIQEREGTHKVSDERQTHAFPHPVALDGGWNYFALHTCHRLPNKCLLCRLVIKIPRHIPVMQARLILPLGGKAEKYVCAWVTVLTSSSLNFSSSICSFRSSASFSRSLVKYEKQRLIPVLYEKILYAWTYTAGEKYNFTEEFCERGCSSE